MAPGTTHIASGTARTRDHRTYQWEADLAPMRMTTEVEVYSMRRRVCYQLWRVHEQDFKHLLGDTTQGPGEVIAAVIMRVVQAREPDGVSTMLYGDGLIHQHGDAQAFEHRYLLRHVVVAKHTYNAI